MTAVPGTRLGPYEILASVGAGGMGEVYKARDTRLDRIVALKICKEKFSERFDREARAVAALNHPNICHLYDVGPNYLVMEYVDGVPLRGPLPLDKAVEHASQMLDALDAAHSKGITHRDLKPDNILVTKQGLKLLDFGLAKQTSPLQESDTTHTIVPEGQISGTLQYMSPEQLQGKEIDTRSDLFSFGCVLYEMVTGKHAFEGSSAASVIAAILERQPAPLATAPPLDRVVQRALAKDPDRRFQTARDLKAALAWAVEHPLPVSVVRPGTNWWKAAAGALGLGLVAAAVFLWAPWRPAQQFLGEPLVTVDLDLGTDVSLESSLGPAAILSPDGQQMVFVSRGSDGIRSLFTRRLDQPKAALLPKTDGAYAPFFSPDGKWVGFFAQGKLKKTHLDGGEPVVICDAPNGRGASWGDDNTIVAALNTRGGLSLVSPVDGTTRSLTELGAGEIGNRWPQVLPGGKAVLFMANNVPANYEDAAITVVSIATHERKDIAGHHGMFPRYLPNGQLIYYAKRALFAVPFDLERLEARGPATMVMEEISHESAFGSVQLDFARNGTLLYRNAPSAGLYVMRWMDSAGHTEPLLSDPARYGFPRVSPDGNRVAFTITEGSSADIWVYDSRRASKTRLTSGTGVNSYPVWSADGTYLVFASAGGISWVRADGAEKPQLLTSSKGLPMPSGFGAEGKKLLYTELNRNGGASVQTLPLTGGSGLLKAGDPEMYLQGGSSLTNAFPAFSPNGRWLAIMDSGSGINEVYIRAFPDRGVKLQISNQGGSMPVWSRDGRQLFYAQDQRIMAVNLTEQGESIVADKPRLWSQQTLANVGVAFPPFDSSPDGKRLAVLMPAEGAEKRGNDSHVMVAVNFFDELRRRLSEGSK